MRARIGVLLAAMALAGCGGGGSHRSGSSQDTDLHAAAVQVSHCMREKGYDMPDPTFGADDTPQFDEPGNLRGNEAYEQARQECRRPFNDAWVAAGRPNRKEQDRENLLGFAQCMRDHGVNVPDPDARGNWVTDKQLLSSPAWRQAAEACRDKLPAGSKVPGIGDDR